VVHSNARKCSINATIRTVVISSPFPVTPTAALVPLHGALDQQGSVLTGFALVAVQAVRNQISNEKAGFLNHAGCKAELMMGFI